MLGFFIGFLIVGALAAVLFLLPPLKFDLKEAHKAIKTGPLLLNPGWVDRTDPPGSIGLSNDKIRIVYSKTRGAHLKEQLLLSTMSERLHVSYQDGNPTDWDRSGEITQIVAKEDVRHAVAILTAVRIATER